MGFSGENYETSELLDPEIFKKNLFIFCIGKADLQRDGEIKISNHYEYKLNMKRMRHHGLS